MQPPPSGIRIRSSDLTPDTLRNVIEEFVTRDGTEMTDGARKVEQVENLLQKGRAEIWFDEQTRTCTIVMTER